MTETRARLWILLLASLSISACQPPTEDASPDDAGGPADSVLRGGKFFTVDEAQVWAEAVAIKDGRFVYVGDDAGVQSFVGPDTDRFDLGGKLIIPGLVDSHTHPGLMGRETAGYTAFPLGGGPRGRLPGGGTKEEILAAVEAYAEANPDLAWIEMGSWSADLYGVAGPHKRDLDRVVPDRPVMLGSVHNVWVNSVALEMMGIDSNTPDPVPGLSYFVRDAAGEPTGWIKEWAAWPYAQHLIDVDRESNKEGIDTFLEYLSSHGVTTLLDAGNNSFHDLTYSLLAELEAAGRLPVRYEGSYHIFVPDQVSGAIDELQRLRRTYGSERLTFNTIKIHFDGTDEIRTGAVLEPFSDDPGNRGATLLDTEELSDFIVQLHEARIDLHLHIVADRGVRIALDAVQAARSSVDGEFYPRVTICHLDIIDTVDYPRFEQLGVIANYTPQWHGLGDRLPLTHRTLGEERFARMLLVQPLLDDGAVVTFSSDVTSLGGMERANPYLGMQIGHNRQYHEQGEAAPIRLPLSERLDLEDLLKGYTLSGAYQLRMEDQLGSIEVGKLADLVVLDRNLFEIDRYEIHEVRPEAVILEGEIIRGSLDGGAGARSSAG
ncbi:MAG TPA: amidohydrolase family protein [Acidobacteriota bacterium]|nr:amidohydrolase family protein [Acidobacteriota bacterium]